ncbi:MAG: HlyD family efflux transporter periplasmic adaptor subunit [Natronohydrobacter sp.]|nr:HlyD family efflux transporter periplasmic adaptor subunit [Natronohydrobacter sp.]
MTMFRKLALGLIGLGIVAALVWALWPQPQRVDLATVIRAPMQGAITAQGVTRVRASYTIAAPITGSVTRSPVEVGDAVVGGETIVALIRPADPVLMDARSRAQAEAAVVEAEAAVAVAETDLRQTETALSHARVQLARSRALAESGTIPHRMLEDIETAYQSATQAVEAAQSRLDLARASLIRAQAQLIGPDMNFDPSDDPGACCMRILAPQTGLVLGVTDMSARLVQAGAPLLTIGNLDEMEIELDLLSTDAVRVPGEARALVENWGGAGVLEAQLRRIEPSAFTRVSALGIEEQRVRLRLDLLAGPQERPGLGEGFRVTVRLILWEAQDVLQLPQAALFRQAGDWAVFVEEDGRAKLKIVEIGRQADGQAEVLGGVPEGARVLLYPGGAIADGVSIRAREG